MRQLLIGLSSVTLFCCRGGGQDSVSPDPDAAAASEDPAVPSVVSGLDWSLPAGTTRLASAGFWAPGAAHTAQTPHRGFSFPWAQLNPGDGSYDWSPITAALAAAHSGGYGIVIRLPCSTGDGTKSFVPAWVRANPTVKKVDIGDGSHGIIDVYQPWNPFVQSSYLKFVAAFEAQGFASDPALLGLYVHGLSESLGEEMNLTATAVSKLESIGMTPTNFESTWEDRMKAWADAFGADAGKLAWVGVDYIDGSNYSAVGPALDSAAMSDGLGLRAGWIEHYLHIVDPQYGQSVTTGGYLQTDPSFPPIAQDRYFGDEMESIKAGLSDSKFAFQSSVMRSLQMRYRLMWTSPGVTNIDPQIADYFNLTAGKGPANAPDAFVWLREQKARADGCNTVRNFERWLYQREAPGSNTVAVEPVSVDSKLQECNESQQNSARSTQHSTGQTRISMFVDRAFLPQGTSAKLTLKVSFLDKITTWHVDYCRGSQVVSTGSLPNNTSSGIVKTASITLTGLTSSRCMGGQFDIALVADKNDLTASIVRLVR